MRAALAIATVVLLLVIAAAPHAHGGALGVHECVACAAANADRARPQPVAPAVLPIARGEAVLPVAVVPAVCGAPLGAIPGQSPPLA